MRRPAVACLLLASALALAACGGDTSGVAKRSDGSDMDALPTPQRAGGSVTGMPDRPGPGQSPPEASSIASASTVGGDMAIDDSGVDDSLDNSANAGDEDANPSGEPSSGDAVNAIQAYYAALQSKDFATAYALWGDGGRASGQTPEQFAAGFADDTSLVVTPDAPARMEGAAGSRYVEVPVAVEITSSDGRVRRYVGAYTLQRSVVDGATDAQRAWHIASADLRELKE